MGVAGIRETLVPPVPPQTTGAGPHVGAHVNRLSRSQAPGPGLVVADVAAHLRGWRGRTASDGFHPDDEGDAAWTEAFADATRVTDAEPGAVTLS